MLTAVILAGGKGERFWPRSRTHLPKQFLNLVGQDTMLQATVKRLSKLVALENVYISTGQCYFDLVSKQIPKLQNKNILLEPVGRNTAPCIGLSALYIEKIDPEAVMIISPADHVIKDEEDYTRVLQKAIEIASREENIVTIGIKPSYPETGYGYLELAEESLGDCFKLKRFVEKPNRKKAEEYLSKGNYLWNSGMFVMKASTVRKKIQQLMPELHSFLEAMKRVIGTVEEANFLEENYPRLASISIDYGIMEKADSIYAVPGNFGWDDVGSWTSLERLNEIDENGNVLRGNILSINSKNCILEGQEKLIGVIGLEDLIVVDTEDATLICPKEQAQNIKELLEGIRQRKLMKYL